MKRRAPIFCVLAFMLAVATWMPTNVSYGAVSEQATMDADNTGEVLVVYKTNDVSDKEIKDTVRDEDGQVKETVKLSGSEKMAVVETDEKDTVEEAISKYEENPEVEYAQPNYVYTIADDTIASEKSISNVTGDPLYNNQWYLNAINLKKAWDYLENKSHSKVRVAVLDTGLDIDHPDMQVNVNKKLSKDVTVSPYTQLTADGATHGTHVAGTIGATSGNNLGVTGVASGYDNDAVEVMAVDVFTGDTLRASTSNIIKGINYAVDSGAKVINMSLGYTGSATVDTNFASAIKSAYNSGVTVVCAAGNNGKDEYFYPADFNGAISVMATDNKNLLSGFSNYGVSKDICAPGDDIYNIYPGSMYNYKSGTSMATPVLSGVVALMISADPSLTPKQIEQKLYATATNISQTDDGGRTSHGLVNAGYAVSGSTAVSQWDNWKEPVVPTVPTVPDITKPEGGNSDTGNDIKDNTNIINNGNNNNNKENVATVKTNNQTRAVSSKKKVKISWSKKKGAFGYDIYQSKNKGKYKKIKRVGKSKRYITLTEVQGNTYKYKVKSLKKSNGKFKIYKTIKLKRKEISKTVKVSYNALPSYNGYCIEMKSAVKNKNTGKWKWNSWSKVKTITSPVKKASYTKSKAPASLKYSFRIKGYDIKDKVKIYSVIKF